MEAAVVALAASRMINLNFFHFHLKGLYDNLKVSLKLN